MICYNNNNKSLKETTMQEKRKHITKGRIYHNDKTKKRLNDKYLRQIKNKYKIEISRFIGNVTNEYI